MADFGGKISEGLSYSVPGTGKGLILKQDYDETFVVLTDKELRALYLILTEYLK